MLLVRQLSLRNQYPDCFGVGSMGVAVNAVCMVVMLLFAGVATGFKFARAAGFSGNVAVGGIGPGCLKSAWQIADQTPTTCGRTKCVASDAELLVRCAIGSVECYDRLTGYAIEQLAAGSSWLFAASACLYCPAS
jgi:hypothetical protein